MTSARYFPEPRLMLPMTVIRRERMLPDDVDGRVDVRVNDRVTLRDVVARGTNPAPYALIDGERFFGLRNPDDLPKYMDVQVDEMVNADQVIAMRGRRRLVSPIKGRVTAITGGRIIIQSIPTNVEIEAGLNGVVIEVRKGRGVVIETTGALLQGVWGNGKRAVGPLRAEPEGGLSAVTSDAIDIGFRGAIILTRTPLTPLSFGIIADQQFAGVIAPSVEPLILDLALEASCAILLTEGFGTMRMSNTTFRFLDELDGKQATIDAIQPSVLDARRPEVIVNVPLPNVGYRPPLPNVYTPLAQGAAVRVARGDHAGFVGEIIDLPNDPVLLDNGLRVRCAQVQLITTGERLIVPLENLEISGA
jgi:hypothetical protein